MKDRHRLFPNTKFSTGGVEISYFPPKDEVAGSNPVRLQDL